MPLFKGLISTIFLIVSTTGIGFCEDTISVKNGDKDDTLSVFEIEEELYVSLEDVSKLFCWTAVASPLTGRTTISSNGKRLTLFPNTSHCLVLDGSMVELPKAPIEENESFLIPIESIPTLIDILLKKTAIYDSKRNELVISENGTKVNNVKNKGLKLVVIDAGHGGEDSGAKGPTGLKEKEVVLEIAVELAKLLEKAGIETVITRKDDTFISLPQRTIIANEAQADLFVSIHINANPNKKTRGSEVYIFNFKASNKHAEYVAKAENIGVDNDVLTSIIKDLKKRCEDDASIAAAGYVLNHLIKVLKLPVRNSKQILRAPFFVLANTDMAAVLVEIAFISNKTEEKLMKDKKFRKKAAEAIYKGIMDYKKNIESSAKLVEQSKK